MRPGILNAKIPLFYPIIALILAGHLILPLPALSAPSLLKKIIIAHNRRALEKSIMDGTYGGEKGILWIRPEIGQSLGMKVYIDQDYLDSRELSRKAKASLEKAENAMASQKKEKFPGKHVQKIADHFLFHKEGVESAKKKLMAYRSRLNSGVDDRFDEGISSEVMNRLLEKCMKKTANKLRDALGCFYNLCQGENVSDLPLTPENVPFVNYVFHRFIREVSEEALAMFDLDRDDRHKDKRLNYDWKKAVEKRGSKHIPLLEATLNKFRNKIYGVDPLLFMALMRRESTFNPFAISPVGAAGLTQIMPKTAKELGMKNIYMPAYLQQAVGLVRRERKTRDEAIAILFQINENNKLHYASRARALMQKSLRLGKKSRRLFTLYKKELLRERTDDRLQPAQAIEYGLKYFARLMKEQRGDISLALASYNAGPHRVRKFQGIPPYAETVHFRNQVLKSYRNYLRKAMGGI